MCAAGPISAATAPSRARLWSGASDAHDPGGGVSGSGGLDLFKGVVDQHVVVFFGEIALNQFRGDPE